ncbi:glycosyltransferase [Lysinibacillus sp. CD3-6]|uniref:glycosyltransferase n=1 Tax=Lysinibacillus sp. CD3-6 TaxID=2892541 RepID=UPI001D17315E|nr:glycosyltransferase [Lysinibacillus sp. CD3-6]UED81972.1 glycosyltransferase [Lysinibacillus sp. CD3-6]
MILNPAYDFLNADYKNPNLTKVKLEELDSVEKPKFNKAKIITLSVPGLLLTAPLSAFAATTDSTFKNVYDAVMNIFDAGVVIVIIFAGAAWTLGHRSKAIELLIGVCCGYLLARHAIDIRDFLKSI